MTPLDRLRLEKAAADCGFEMTAVPHQDGLELLISPPYPRTRPIRNVTLLPVTCPHRPYQRIGEVRG
jgi:hypothetical protein